ncbi:MAG: cation/H(+) antiporter [Alphaproteobacteria bacterium]|nr:cation/H(+) antiporter [Alphaproteobacteria bacterium]
MADQTPHGAADSGLAETVTSTLSEAVSSELGEAVQEQLAAAAHNELTGLAAVALVALLCGLLLTRFRQPAVVGYILAGVVLGPSGVALVTDREQISILAELGVLLLLFVIGMELSLRAFKLVWITAVGTALLQIALSLGVMLLFHFVFGLALGTAILLGFVVAISSTAVSIKILEAIGELRTRVGRVTVGILIAQDLAVVPMMLIVQSMGGDGALDAWAVLKIVFSIALLAGLIVFLSRRRRVNLPFVKSAAGNLELTAIAGLAYCFGGAALSGAFGLSPAYGAFLAGLFIGNTTERRAMMDTVEPIQSVLLMIFFVSIGLLMDPSYIWANIWFVLFLWFFVSVFKTALNIGILRLFRQSWPRAFLASMALAQIGEFSFLLAQTGLSAGVIDDAIHKLVVSVTVLSLAISPIWLEGSRRLQRVAMRSITSIRFLILLLAGRETRSMTKAGARLRRRARAARYLHAKRRRAKRRAKAAGQATPPAAPAAPPGDA